LKSLFDLNGYVFYAPNHIKDYPAPNHEAEGDHSDRPIPPMKHRHSGHLGSQASISTRTKFPHTAIHHNLFIAMHTRTLVQVL
jgi:hypothetical protein